MTGATTRPTLHEGPLGETSTILTREAFYPLGLRLPELAQMPDWNSDVRKKDWAADRAYHSSRLGCWEECPRLA
jgi:hypothetical protein